jgi:hypothetical protein
MDLKGCNHGRCDHFRGFAEQESPVNYPKHNPETYVVQEHHVVDAPADLWPLIRDWMYRARQAVRP